MRRRRDAADGPQHPQQVQPVEVGQAEVEDDEIRPVVERAPQAGHGRPHHRDRVTGGAERARQQAGDRRSSSIGRSRATEAKLSWPEPVTRFLTIA